MTPQPTHHHALVLSLTDPWTLNGHYVCRASVLFVANYFSWLLPFPLFIKFSDVVTVYTSSEFVLTLACS